MINYLLQFGTGDPRTFTGLAPTFLIYKDKDGNNVTPPGITEVPSSTGLYYFTWGTTTNIAFLADAATTSPGTAGRYISGMLDQSDRIAEIGSSLVALGNTSVALGVTNVALGTTAIALGATGVAIGTTNTAIGNTGVAIGASGAALGTTIVSMLSGISSALLLSIGSTASLIGDSTTNPVDLFGYLKRVGELYQGNQQFIKGAGTLTQYDRTGATTLYSKTIANNASLVTKT